jgi:hypothetical protein
MTSVLPQPALQPTVLPFLSKEDEKRMVEKKRPFHILTAFFQVSEGPTKKIEDLHKSILSAFTTRVSSDSDLSSVGKAYIVLGNKNVPLPGDRLWDKAKEIKRTFANAYLPHNLVVNYRGNYRDYRVIQQITVFGG